MSETNNVRRGAKSAMISANTSIDLELLAEKVYRLMQADARLIRALRGKTRVGR